MADDTDVPDGEQSDRVRFRSATTIRLDTDAGRILHTTAVDLSGVIWERRSDWEPGRWEIVIGPVEP